jgi:hypothetical protein
MGQNDKVFQRNRDPRHPGFNEDRHPGKR